MTALPRQAELPLKSLEIKRLCLSRGTRFLINNLDFTASAGDLVCLTGPNGVGKTTLLRALAGLYGRDSGSVQYLTDEAHAPEDCPQIIHFCGHQDALGPTRTVWAELRFQAEYLAYGAPVHWEPTLAALDLKPLLELECRLLSAGQKRRVSLARLMMIQRDVWVLDEPMAPLDTVYRDKLRTMLREHIGAGGLALMAVHDDPGLPFRALDLTPVNSALGESPDDPVP